MWRLAAPFEAFGGGIESAGNPGSVRTLPVNNLAELGRSMLRPYNERSSGSDTFGNATYATFLAQAHLNR